MFLKNLNLHAYFVLFAFRTDLGAILGHNLPAENHCCKGISGNLWREVAFLNSHPLYSVLFINMLINLEKEFSTGLNERRETEGHKERENV